MGFGKTIAWWKLAAYQPINYEARTPLGYPRAVTLTYTVIIMIGQEYLDSLVGKNIELICFAQYSAYIHLENEVTLTLQAAYEYEHEGRQEVQKSAIPYEQSSLMRILEKNITLALIDSEGNLHLTISNGDKLRVFKESGFESFSIRMQGKEVFG